MDTNIWEAKEAAALFDIKLPQLQYWFVKMLLSPYDPGGGRGTKRRLDFKNLVEIYIIKKLFETGTPIDFIASVMQSIRADQPDLFFPGKVNEKSEPIILCIATSVKSGRPYRADIGPESKIVSNAIQFLKSPRNISLLNLTASKEYVMKKIQ
jgi:DNA-binding transcriptional MerR regulator